MSLPPIEIDPELPPIEEDPDLPPVQNIDKESKPGYKYEENKESKDV